MHRGSFSIQPRLKSSFITFTGALFLLLGAFYNGYPLVYSDTSTYISSGFELETPTDRPIMYGLFIRITSLNGFSLWPVVLFQSALLGYLILLTCRQWFPEKNYRIIGLFILAFLSVFTGLSWVASQIMPDIFTPVCLLCMILIITSQNLSRREITAIYIIFLFANAMHFSHIIFSAGLLLTLLVFKWVMPAKFASVITYRKLFTFFLLMIAGVATSTAALSKSGHVFTMGTLVENGILKKYLEESCTTENYGLCFYKDSLPKTAIEFIWDQKSPMYKMGGWKATKAEYTAIIRATYTQPKYLLLHLTESAKSTFNQLTKFKIGDGNGVFTEGSLLFERIGQFVPSEQNAFRVSKQNKQMLDSLLPINHLFAWMIILSMLLIPATWLIKPKLFVNPPDMLLLLLLLAGVLINAWVSGTFANAIDRLGCKMMWLIPFTILLMLIRSFSSGENRGRGSIT